MRHGRTKAARKTLQYFGRTIGLKAPYSILLDATFVAALFQQKILPVKPRLDRILQTPTPVASSSSSPHSPTSSSLNTYCITQAALDELKEIQEGLQAKKHIKADAFREAFAWVRKECVVLKSIGEPTNTKKGGEDKEEMSKHASLSTPAQDELLRRIREEETPYIVASQDEELLHILRQMGNVPIVRLANNTVLLLEHPSKQSQTRSKGMEQQKWKHSLPEAEKALVDLVRKEKRASAAVESQAENTGQQTATTNRQRMKKAKGPNPLSCKRKQLSDGNNGGTKESSSQKRRKRAQKKQSTGGESN